jgi:hypothetical protein
MPRTGGMKKMVMKEDSFLDLELLFAGKKAR